MVQQYQYGEKATEDPNAHLVQFLEICSTVKLNGVSDKAIQMGLFPFSLKDKARMWYPSLVTGSFRQSDDESLYELWERFREMIRKYPNHGFGVDHQVCIFYNRCNIKIKRLLDASANGSLPGKGSDTAIRIIEDMATNSYQWPEESQVQMMKKVATTSDQDPITLVAAQLFALNDTLNSRFDALTQVKSNQAIEEQKLEQCSAISLRSGRFYEETKMPIGDPTNLKNEATPLEKQLPKNEVPKVSKNSPKISEDKARSAVFQILENLMQSQHQFASRGSFANDAQLCKIPQRHGVQEEKIGRV
ncbi:hypothetical protein C2S51_025114 [Perilla frutescens var. frutescens]|nr:hypothetical protein C2S51_025114 [Perilla frutescens var. frutescens]